MGKGVGVVTETGRGISGDLMEDFSRLEDLQNSLVTICPILTRLQFIIAMSLDGPEKSGFSPTSPPSAIW